MLLQVSYLKQGLWGLLLFGIVTPHLLAADIGKGDVFGQAGYYTELGDGGGTWPLVGGGGGFNLGHHLALFAEFNYIHPSTSLGGASAAANLYEAGGGGRIFIPLHSERFRPYVPVLGGFIRGHAAVTLNGIQYASQWMSSAYVGTGFGTEIGITKRVGIRPEFSYSREFWSYEFGLSSQANSLRAMIGVYYRFGIR